MTTYAITGHTDGIGKKIFERLNPNILGFSRSTGYNINNLIHRKRIVEEVANCDVFINNAADGNGNIGQTYMFLDLLEVWKNCPEKTIINVGSRIAEFVTLPDQAKHLYYYHVEKTVLKEFTYRMQSISSCQIKYKWFGYVGTPKILSKYPHFTEKDYITEEQAVDIILS
jgi:hypothetical protein